MASVSDWAAHLTWQVLHPSERGGFVERVPPPLARVGETPGALMVSPGSPGEPVLLTLGLGWHPEVARLGGASSLVARLNGEGFSVYLISPSFWLGAPAGRSLEAVAAGVPSLVEQVRIHSGYPRVHWLGFGWGALLGLHWAGAQGGAGLASLVALDAPVWGIPAHPLSLARAGGGWPRPLPVGRASAWVTPWLGAEHTRRLSAAAPASVRAALRRGGAPQSMALLAQLARWHRAGRWEGARDYLADLGRVRAPLYCATRHAPSGEALRRAWGGPVALSSPQGVQRPLDWLLGPVAAEQVFLPLLAWLRPRRRLAWEEPSGWSEPDVQHP